LTLDSKRLEWRYDRKDEKRRERRDVGDDMLERFLRFADGEVQPNEILAFAKSFGVFHHSRASVSRGFDEIERWRETARDFGAILNCAADCRQRRVDLGTDRWKRVRRLAAWEAGAVIPQLLPAMVADAAEAVVLPSVRLTLQGGVGRGFRLHLGGVDFRGALCAEMLRELQGRERAMFPCAGCGNLHQPRGQSGRRSFCAVCRADGAPVRFAKRDHRERLKLARPR
jgi:hypothetical protein